MSASLYQDLKAAGYSEEEIREGLGQFLQEAGFSDEEINAYFENESGRRVLSLAGDEQDEEIRQVGVSVQNEMQAAAKEGRDLGFADAVSMGLKNSVAGMLIRRDAEVVPTAEEAATLNMPERVSGGVAGVLADAPVFTAGAAAGAKAGALVGSVFGPAGAAVGAVVGGGAGMFGVHAAARRFLVDLYRKGKVSSAGELWERIKNVSYSDVAVEAGKSALVGMALAPAGGAARVSFQKV